MKLQLGCFHQGITGWVNTDITPNLFIARIPLMATVLHRLRIMNDLHYTWHREGRFKGVKYLNVVKKFPYKDGVSEAVFCSHMLEHLDPNQAKRMFEEVFRILQPGGVFRVAVPDLEWAVTLYDADQPDRFLDAMYEHVGGSAKNSHKWMYTRQSLKRFFEEVGFINVENCAFQEGRIPDVGKLDSRPENSIFVEGIHP